MTNSRLELTNHLWIKNHKTNHLSELLWRTFYPVLSSVKDFLLCPQLKIVATTGLLSANVMLLLIFRLSEKKGCIFSKNVYCYIHPIWIRISKYFFFFFLESWLSIYRCPLSRICFFTLDISRERWLTILHEFHRMYFFVIRILSKVKVKNKSNYVLFLNYLEPRKSC